MSRPLLTRLFRTLSPDRPTSADRRAFLKGSLALGASALISTQGWARSPSSGRVLVLGGGFAGLSAAHEARAAGLDPHIFEARDRVGGRVLSIHGERQHHEAGAELIGTNHPRWLALADLLGLTLRELTEPDGDEVVFLRGQQLSPREVRKLWRGLDRPLKRLTRMSREIPGETPWTAPEAEALDQLDVHQWLLDNTRDPEVARFISMLIASDAAVPTEDQSLLGLLACISGGGGERYWTESEALRCAQGNQSLALRLAERLGESRIHLGTPITTVRWGEGSPSITLADGTTHEGDAIVCALPPSVWSRITFDPPLPSDLKPTMGPALKHLVRLRQPVWEASGRSPNAYGEGLVSLTWDGTDGQEGEQRWLVSFSGAGQAGQSLTLPEQAREAAYAAEHERFFPGFAGAAIERRYYDWPNDPHALAGYSTPGLGQVTTTYRTLHQGLFPLIFAGEHCSTAFPGYMEGALESGLRAARMLRDRMG